LVPTARPPVPLSSLGGRAGTPRAASRAGNLGNRGGAGSPACRATRLAFLQVGPKLDQRGMGTGRRTCCWHRGWLRAWISTSPRLGLLLSRMIAELIVRPRRFRWAN